MDRSAHQPVLDEDPRTRGLLGAAGVLGVAALLSRILGLVREQVFAVLFGAGNAMDAFNVAFRIPNALRNVFAEGAMSAALIPVFTRVRLEKGDARAWRLAGLVFRVVAVASALLAILGIVTAPLLVGVLAGSFREVPGKIELTVVLTRALFPCFPLIALSAAMMAVLNCRGKFFFPALSAAVFNGVAIVSGVAGVIVLRRLHGSGSLLDVHPIEGMAFGMIVGGVAQVLFQLPLLYRQGYRWSGRAERLDADTAPEGQDLNQAWYKSWYKSWYNDEGLRHIVATMPAGTLGLAGTQISVLVNTVLATTQGVGAVSWLSYAFRLMQFPIGIFGASLASATLTRISSEWAKKDIRAASQTLEAGLRHCFAINLPAAAGLALLANPIIELIFQYGNFQPRDTRATALALSMYALGLPAYSMVKILAPACTAMGAVRLPLISSIVSVFVSLALNLALIGPWGYWSLALGTSVGAAFNALCLLWFLNQRLISSGIGLSLRPLGRAFLACLASSVLMGTLLKVSNWGISTWFSGFHGWIFLTRLIKGMLLAGEGLLLTGALSSAFGCDETVQSLKLFANTFKKKLRQDLF